jgi:hypothetical protein
VSLSCSLLVTWSNLLISLKQGPIIRAKNLPHLPSMEHGKVFGGFSKSVFPRKSTIPYKLFFNYMFMIFKDLNLKKICKILNFRPYILLKSETHIHGFSPNVLNVFVLLYHFKCEKKQNNIVVKNTFNFL